MLRDVLLAVPASGATSVESSRNLQWWRKEKEEVHETALQALALREPWMKDFTIADLGDDVIYAGRRVGPGLTLQLLYGARGFPERQQAIIGAAVAFELVGSARRYCPPSPPAVEAAIQTHASQLYALAGFDNARPAWLPVHTCVLPVTVLREHIYRRYLGAAVPLASVEALERRVTDVSAALQAVWTPVRIRVPATEAEADAVRQTWKESQRLADFKCRVLNDLADREQKASEQRRWANAEQEARDRVYEQHRKLHPRWGEWRQLPDAELKELVWAKQLTALAQEFGVSDMAIRKRCDARHIERPPQGYWLRAGARELA